MELYHTTDMDGISELNPTVASMDELIEKLDEPGFEDAAHPDLSLVHDPSGWSITLYPSGIVTFENFEEADESPRFMTAITREKALSFWVLLSRGAIDDLKALPWLREEA